MAEAVGKEIKQLRKHLVSYDLSVASNGIGDYFTPQEAVDNAPANKKTTIQMFGGSWQKPDVPANKKIKFVMRQGAEWK